MIYRIFFIACSVVVLGLLFVYGIKYKNNVSSQSSQESQEQSSDAVVKIATQTSTSNPKDNKWQIYKNEQYGFSFTYPNDWKVDQKSQDLLEVSGNHTLPNGASYAVTYPIKIIKGTAGDILLSPTTKIAFKDNVWWWVQRYNNEWYWGTENFYPDSVSEVKVLAATNLEKQRLSGIFGKNTITSGGLPMYIKPFRGDGPVAESSVLVPINKTTVLEVVRGDYPSTVFDTDIILSISSL